MLALEIYLGLVLAAGLLVVWKLIAHWLGGGFRSDPYPPEAAEAPETARNYASGGPVLKGRPVIVGDPIGEHFKTAPREQRLDDAEVDRLVAGFDWPRYATWLKEPS